MDLESRMPKNSSSSYDLEKEQLPMVMRSKKKSVELLKFFANILRKRKN